MGFRARTYLKTKQNKNKNNSEKWKQEDLCKFEASPVYKSNFQARATKTERGRGREGRRQVEREKETETHGEREGGRRNIFGQQDGSSGKGTCHQV